MVLDQQILAYYLGIPEITVRLPFVLLSLAILLIILQEKRAGFSHRKSFIIFPFLFLIGVISTSLLESFLITLFFMNSILAYPIFYGYPISVVAVNFTLSILIFILYRNQISIAFNEEDLFKTETIFYD
jgi:membrane-associated HD superfamily phosphohydrolase